jgi:hypothetical protein
MSGQSTILELWKENRVDHAIFTFTCGGDNMGDTEWGFYDEKNNIMEALPKSLEEMLDSEIYKHVDFYVNSDGHYQGESGTVEVTFDEEEDELTYSKSSESEYSESHDSDMLLPLTDNEIRFIVAHVFNINGSDRDVVINYKHDFLMSDDDDALVEELKKKIAIDCNEYEPQNVEGTLDEWFSFTTNTEGNDIIIKDNSLVIHMSNSSTVYRDGD